MRNVMTVFQPYIDTLDHVDYLWSATFSTRLRAGPPQRP